MFHSKYSDIIQTISGGVRPSRVGGGWTAVVLRCVASCVRSRHWLRFYPAGLRRGWSTAAIGRGGWRRCVLGWFWVFLRRRGEKVGQDDWPRALMASHPLSDCTETLVRRRLVSIHLQRQPALIRWWTGVWHRARLPHDLLRCLPDRRLWRIPLSPTEKCFAKLFFFNWTKSRKWKVENTLRSAGETLMSKLNRGKQINLRNQWGITLFI